MKKISTLAALLISIASFAGSPDWSKENYEVGKKYAGYIVKNNGDTIKGYIVAQERSALTDLSASNQTNVIFYIDPEHKKQKFKPTQLKSYMVTGKIYRSIKYSGGFSNSLAFNLLVKEGAISQYEWYALKEGAGSIMQKLGETWEDFNKRRFSAKVVFQKKDEKPLAITKLMTNFSRRVSVLVAENKELATQVRNKKKGYRMLSIFKIINEYNTWSSAQ
jgi:hypothetical protein